MNKTALLLVFILHLCFSHPLQGQSLSITTLPETDPLVQLCARIMSEVYQRLGLDLDLRYMPPKRALVDANNGKSDGELFRIAGIESLYPNLVRVPVPIYTIEGVVFSKLHDFQVAGWESLRPYRIWGLRGVHFSEVGTRGFNREFNNRVEPLFKKLAAERLDVVVETKFSGAIILQQLGLQQVIKTLEPSLARFELYHYLHKDHQALLPMFEATLTEMQRDGSLAALILQFEQALLESLLGD
ncbi:substrate-binding periplasmic protein [Aliagarivorans marinus]|uniref:substrate-binding periplasmic protein n=1 Tax=Aliagarivorans marinus TaxID=561965 RepID=UPI00040A1E7F|nr:transporter substrate-binding domain-containing protein [Aliagarivorans marinus]